MSQHEEEAGGARDKLRELEEEVTKLHERLADAQRELVEPTRTIKRTIASPVIVSTAMITKIWKRLEQEKGNPVMICKTADGRITSWRTLDAALDQANAPDKEIEAVWIQNERSAAKGGVELYAAGVVRVNVFGEEEKAERLFTDLEERIMTGVRGSPGYRWFASYGHSAARLVAIVLVVYTLMKNVDIVASLVEVLAAKVSGSPLIAAVGLPVAAGVVGWTVRRVDGWTGAAIRRYWPIVVVEIGNGKQREKAASQVRKAVVRGGGAIAMAAVGLFLI